LRDSYWSRQLLARDLPLMPARCDQRGDLLLGDPPLHVSRNMPADFLLRDLGKARELVCAGGSLAYEGEGRAILSFGGARFEITTDQTVQIVHEIFYERIYAIGIPRPAVVVDVGMNVGIASLFFALQGHPVHAFEPFAATYALAQRNFALNAGCAGRITSRQVALGEVAGEFPALYCAESPGDCGLTPIPEHYRRGRAVRQEMIRVERAADVLLEIARSHTDRRLIVKLDCEGSEVGILRSLHAEGIVRKVDAFLIEWHRRVSQDLPASIERLLLDEGFVVFSAGWPGREVGMIHAVRS
jgi:FkbM family methyltransferase